MIKYVLIEHLNKIMVNVNDFIHYLNTFSRPTNRSDHQ